MAFRSAPTRAVALIVLGASLGLGIPAAVAAPPVPSGAFRGALMESLNDSAVESEALARFYAARDQAPLWMAPDAAELRRAFFAALEQVQAHGLPAVRYDAEGLSAAFRDLRSDRDLGVLEVRMSRAFLAWARDVSSGVLEPGRLDAGIVREVTRPDPLALLHGLEREGPRFLRELPPQTPEYAALMREKLRLEQRVIGTGWGPAVPAGATLRPGDDGPAVLALRDRLAAMGVLAEATGSGFDAVLTEAVRSFQAAHGLVADGVVGEATLDAINTSPEARLQSVIAAMERERWLGPREARHVWVNLADFTTQIVEDGQITFETRSVIGSDTRERRTPEFSDQMTYMVINPSWSIPRSIIGRDYLPALQRDPYAVGHLQVVDASGREIPRGAIDFTQFSARNFPFHMRQAPGPQNALGTVKFMFPNKYAIYLHDTPQKNLFGRDMRAFSNGCIRLNDPHAFAYALLAGQVADPEAYFARILATGRETTVPLERPVPIHLDYRTAFVGPDGAITFRRDIYGRDARIFEALTQAGVVLGGVQG
ncbi:murein L,D-transpeptidase [Plastorhodobacter daqingensis]|uniref:Murein L,D-transpeptidase n=1 Tax=Plastorhodobacter daqingensis TaxID=1387281 RepID=A0ABW2UJU3_9RHOB